MLRWGPVLFLAAGCSGAGGGSSVVCTPVEAGGSFCVPDAGRAANLDVKLQLREECRSSCDTGVVACRVSVSVDAGVVSLSLSGETCSNPRAACDLSCGIRTHDCALPALPDGTYTVTSSGKAPQQLVVGAGGAPGCKLP